MAAPFEHSTWADQWDYNSDASSYSSGQQTQQSGGKRADYNNKIKSAASTGVVKAKLVALTGEKKVKSGTSSSIQWIKDQYQKKTQK